MSKVLITGGAGFIGGHISELFVSKGHDVVVYDNFSTGREENLESIRSQIQIVKGDILDGAAMESALKGVDYVIHHAAEIAAIKSVEEPELVNEINVAGTLKLLVMAEKCGVKRLIMASSSAVYGDTGNQPQKETFLPKPLSPYGASKICGEHYCNVFNLTYNIEAVCLRYFNVYGQRQNPKSQYAAVIPKFIGMLMAGQGLHIYGDGEQTRDFVNVKDVARANYEACFNENAAGDVFNIAGGRSVSVNELAEMLKSLTKADAAVIHDPARAGEIKYSISDTTKAAEILGFHPEVTLEQGLDDLVEWFRLHRS